MFKHLYICGLALLLLTPFCVALAQTINYIPIAQIPFAPTGGTMTAYDFVTAVYRLSITVAAMLAVIKIMYGGVQWMLTDVVTSKETAKKDIRGAIIGLLIVLSAVFILEIINPNLKVLRLFDTAPAIIITPGGGSSIVPANARGGAGNSGRGSAGNSGGAAETQNSNAIGSAESF